MQTKGASLAYAILRSTLGVTFVCRGMRHLTDAVMTSAPFHPAALDHAARAVAPALPYAELGLGALLVAGIATRVSLVGAGLLTAAGVAVHTMHNDTAHLTVHLVLAGVSYGLLSHPSQNRLSLDAAFGLVPSADAEAEVEATHTAASGKSIAPASKDAKDGKAAEAENEPSGAVFARALAELTADQLGPFGRIVVREQLSSLRIPAEALTPADAEKLIEVVVGDLDEGKRHKFTLDAKKLIPSNWIQGAVAAPAPTPSIPKAPSVPKAAAAPPPPPPPRPSMPEPKGTDIVKALVLVASDSVGSMGASIVHEELSKMGLSEDTMEWMHYDLLVDSVASEISEDAGREKFLAGARKVSVAGLLAANKSKAPEARA